MNDLAAACIRPQIANIEVTRRRPASRFVKGSTPTLNQTSRRPSSDPRAASSPAARFANAWRPTSLPVPTVQLAPQLEPPPCPSQERVARYNVMYERLVRQLQGVPEFQIPPYNPRVRPVKDSLQIHLQVVEDHAPSLRHRFPP